MRSVIGNTFLDGRYLPLYLAGIGGTSRIFASFDTRRGELVAIKKIFAESYRHLRQRDNQLMEEISLRDIDHPQVLRFVDRFWHGDSFCMVTELIGGLDLEVYLDRRPLSESLFLHLAGQMMFGLRAIHRSGYLHGDLKPQNMMVHLNEDGGVGIKILDFGLADILPDEIHFGKPDFIVHEIFHTPEYVAPELIRGGTASELSDLYGLGQTFWHCLTGEAALVGDSPEATARMQAEQHPPSIVEKRPDLQPRLAMWIDRFLLKSPKSRWRSVDAALEAFRALDLD
jgi:serine/threonine protein kinase